MTGTLGRYFGMRFVVTFTAIFAGVFGLVMLVDYLEMMRRHAQVPNVSVFNIALASIYRVPQIIERILPFAVLVGAMSSFLNLSRRLELVIARSSGISAWQFTLPAVAAALAIGLFATTVYNPVAAIMHEQSKRMEAEMSGRLLETPGSTSTGIGTISAMTRSSIPCSTSPTSPAALPAWTAPDSETSASPCTTADT